MCSWIRPASRLLHNGLIIFSAVQPSASALLHSGLNFSAIRPSASALLHRKSTIADCYIADLDEMKPRQMLLMGLVLYWRVLNVWWRSLNVYWRVFNGRRNTKPCGRHSLTLLKTHTAPGSAASYTAGRATTSGFTLVTYRECLRQRGTATGVYYRLVLCVLLIYMVLPVLYWWASTHVRRETAVSASATRSRAAATD